MAAVGSSVTTAVSSPGSYRRWRIAHGTWSATLPSGLVYSTVAGPAARGPAAAARLVPQPNTTLDRERGPSVERELVVAEPIISRVHPGQEATGPHPLLGLVPEQRCQRPERRAVDGEDGDRHRAGGREPRPAAVRPRGAWPEANAGSGDERAAGHLDRLLDAQHLSTVGATSASTPPLRKVNPEAVTIERHRVERVRGVRRAVGLEHVVGVAMIGGDHRHPPGVPDRGPARHPGHYRRSRSPRRPPGSPRCGRPCPGWRS